MKGVVYLVVAWLGVGVLDCGVAGCGATSTQSRLDNPVLERVDGAGSSYVKDDDDIPGEDAGNQDDRSLRTYGQKLARREAGLVRSLIRRYYVAASSGNTVLACSLLYLGRAARFDNAAMVPMRYRPAPGSNVFRGKSCGAIAAILFRLEHGELVGGGGPPQVIDIRFARSRGFALLGFRSRPERQMPIVREDGKWRIGALLDSELP